MNRVETKVQAGSISAALAGVVLYLLQQYVFKGSVPAGVVSLVYLAVPGLVAFAAGYIAPHTYRPLPAPPAPPAPPPAGTG